MLFRSEFQFRDSGEESAERLLAIFGAWTPPDGLEFQGFYNYVDGSGGFAIVESDDAATLARGIAPFTPYLDFDVSAILPVEEGTAIAAEGVAFRHSVS